MSGFEEFVDTYFEFGIGMRFYDRFFWPREFADMGEAGGSDEIWSPIPRAFLNRRKLTRGASKLGSLEMSEFGGLDA